MSFNPNDYNVINYKGLAVATTPSLSWLLSIQNPETEIINQLTAQQLSNLLFGTSSLPDGIINGLVFSVDNSGSPKVGSVTVGNYRIGNTTFNLATSFNFNVNASGASNRTDAVLANNAGSVYYMPNYTTLPANTILIASFVVPTGGGNISGISQSSSLVTAYMNSLNNGNFNISGQFQVNGVPIPTSGTTPLTFTQGNLVAMGGGFFKLPLVLTGSKVILGVKVAITSGSTYQKPASDWANNEILNFDTNAAQTITVITS